MASSSGADELKVVMQKIIACETQLKRLGLDHPERLPLQHQLAALQQQAAALQQQEAALQQQEAALRQEQVLLLQIAVGQDFCKAEVRQAFLRNAFKSTIAAAAAAVPPGALRSPDATYDPSQHLAKQAPFLGRDTSMRIAAYIISRVYRRYRGRDPAQARTALHRHLALGLLVAFPGAGKTTFLAMMQRLLKDVLTQDETFKAYVTAAMQSISIDPMLPTLVDEFLLALQACLVLMPCIRIDLAPKLLPLEKGSAPMGVAALRLLHALVSCQPYSAWLADLPQPLLLHITLSDVEGLLQSAVPTLKDLFLFSIDEVNAAEGNWAKELVSAVILHNAQECKMLMLPFVATSQASAAELTGTASGLAQAGLVPLPTLTMDQRWEFVNVLCGKVSGGQLQPLSVEAAHVLRILLEHVGGNPRMLTMLMDELWRTKGQDHLASCIQQLKLEHTCVYLEALHRGVLKLWPRGLQSSVSHRDDVKRRLLGLLLAMVVLDIEMSRMSKLSDLPYVCSVLTPKELLELSCGGLTTVADLEAAGLVELVNTVDNPITTPVARVALGDGGRAAQHDQPLATTSVPSGREGQDRPEGPATRASTRGGNHSQFAAPASSSAQPAAAGGRGRKRLAQRSTSPQRNTQQRSRPDAVGGSSGAQPCHAAAPSTPAAATAACQSPAVRPFVRVLRREESGSPIISTYIQGAAEVELTSSPDTVDMVEDGVVARETSRANSVPVRGSMSLAIVTMLLNDLPMDRQESLGRLLTVFHRDMARPEGLGKERIDVHCLALKFEVLRKLLKLDRWPLSLLLPRVQLPPFLQNVNVLVPHGNFTVAAHHQHFTKDMLQELQAAAHARTLQLPDCDSDAAFAHIGAGNAEFDAVVFLECEASTPAPASSPAAGPSSSAAAATAAPAGSFQLSLFIQSKQRSGHKNITMHAILTEMHKDLKGMVQLPPLEQWQDWQEQRSQEMPLASSTPAALSATPAALTATHKLVYCYITDHVLSAKQQDIQAQLRAGRHPWIEQLIVIPKHAASSWYSELGRVKREAMRLIACAT